MEKLGFIFTADSFVVDNIENQKAYGFDLKMTEETTKV